MQRWIGVVAGAVGGGLLMRERQQRLAAERLAAAVLETLLRAIDANDADTGAHVRRVARYALVLADAADLDERARRNVERVALFHDIGKIDEALFDIIHDNDDRLTPDERREIRTHPERGASVLAPLAAFYPELATGVTAHHERWDGSGYPRRLRGTRIPLSARVVAIADSFDAMTYRRRYQSARSADAAADTIMRGRGTQFDPDLVDLFLLPPVFDEVLRIHRRDHGPRPRPTSRLAAADESSVPQLRFRWRTTTPAPPVPDPALRTPP